MQKVIVVPANPAIHSFGFERVTKTLVDFCKAYPSLPFVSVGCGLAIIERCARSRVKNDFYLVDPAPNSFYPYLRNKNMNTHAVIVSYGMPATHSYTRELVITNPEITKGDGCILLLNWCDYGNNDYDLEAIRLLKPRAILAIVDLTGSAGSAQFHRFLKEETGEYYPTMISSLKGTTTKKEKYACSHETISMQWLDRTTNTTHYLGEPLFEETIECCQLHDDNNKQNIQVLKSRELAKDGISDTCAELKKMLIDFVASVENQ